MLRIFSNARCEAILPSGVNGELSGNACVFENALISKAGFFEELADGGGAMRLTGLQATGDGLPHLGGINSL